MILPLSKHHCFRSQSLHFQFASEVLCQTLLDERSYTICNIGYEPPTRRLTRTPYSVGRLKSAGGKAIVQKDVVRMLSGLIFIFLLAITPATPKKCLNNL